LKQRKTVGGGDGEPDAQGQLNHELFLRDDLGAPREPPQMMAGVAVVVFSVDRVGLADDVPLRGEDLGERVPVVRVEDAVLQVPDLLVKSPECCSIAFLLYIETLS
jgi:hypothetical protein